MLLLPQTFVQHQTELTNFTVLRTIRWTLVYPLNPARRGHDPHSIKGQYQTFNARRSRRRPSRYCPLTGKVSHSRVTEPADLCPVRALAERSLTIRSTEGDERRLAVTLAVPPPGPCSYTSRSAIRPWCSRPARAGAGSRHPQPVHRPAESFLPPISQEAAYVVEHADAKGELKRDDFSDSWGRIVRRTVSGRCRRW